LTIGVEAVAAFVVARHASDSDTGLQLHVLESPLETLLNGTRGSSSALTEATKALDIIKQQLV
jgi:hypothetical protein